MNEWINERTTDWMIDWLNKRRIKAVWLKEWKNKEIKKQMLCKIYVSTNELSEQISKWMAACINE